MADKKLPTYDFFAIKKEDIETFLDANASPAELQDYFTTAYIKKAETVMVPDIVETKDGQKVQRMAKKKDKDGNIVKDENGNPIMVPKKKAVEKKNGEVKEKYSHREAVQWFIKTYVDINPPKAIITNRPQKAAKQKGESDLTKRLREKAKG